MRKQILPLLFVAGLAAAAYHYFPSLTPEQRFVRELEEGKADLQAEITECRAHIALDKRAVEQARLASFRAEHQGADAAALGKNLRARTERMQQANLDRLNALLTELAELEMKLREH